DRADLHSFPTRRSSDLGPPEAPKLLAISASAVRLSRACVKTSRQAFCPEVAMFSGSLIISSSSSSCPFTRVRILAPCCGVADNRSEEHTSELQSLAYLV